MGLCRLGSWPSRRRAEDKGVSEYIGVGHSGTITCAAISPDASFVVSTGSEGAILIWTMPSDVVSKCNEPGPVRISQQ